ncbi:thymidylate synthase [Aeromonas hydrophila]|uniref:thymidylate synthase n=1 Tax=Aeromonas hydrophila TaxID=644 RepID=UPI00111630A5|nr:thymidylate synthase [Aeromonas hydrophila]TNH89097.1 thymidylate synthase [Aeromonas hydrophila]TNI01006.1 thymidylate synthase [Aeromonas hydrophila]TNI97943.1 thymidylate synthase [Aeromonas hydrophila]
MHVVYGDNINSVIVNAIEKIFSDGVNTSSRNGEALTLYDVSIILNNPRSRHLNLSGRKNNIFATFAETLWVLAGMNEIAPYLSFFVPRAKEYSDDGIIWRAAYGERLYAYGQIDNVIKQFKYEGIYTRRAVISLYMPNRDTSESLLEVNLENSLDIPCNNLIHFFVTPDKKLNIKITQRSGDLIFGVSHINIFEFSLLQEFVLFMLQKEVDSELSLGYLHQSITNLHIYKGKINQAKDILFNKDKQDLDIKNHDNIYFASSPQETKKLLHDIVSFIENKIIINIPDLPPIEQSRIEMKAIFSHYNVDYNGNLLWGYCDATLAYVYQNRLMQPITLHSTLSEDFISSVTKNNFNLQIKVAP